MLLSYLQDELQTTIPKVDEEARVINGPLLNERVKIRVINKDKDYCEAKIMTGSHQQSLIVLLSFQRENCTQNVL